VDPRYGSTPEPQHGYGAPAQRYAQAPGDIRGAAAQPPPAEPAGGGVFIGPGVRMSGAVTIVGHGGDVPDWASSTVDDDDSGDYEADTPQRRTGARVLSGIGRTISWMAGKIRLLILILLPITLMVIFTPQGRQLFNTVRESVQEWINTPPESGE
jgi:hypothetical protein